MQDLNTTFLDEIPDVRQQPEVIFFGRTQRNAARKLVLKVTNSHRVSSHGIGM